MSPRQPGTALPWLRPERAEALSECARDRILVLDGAMGTSLQAAGLGPADFGGEDLDGCTINIRSRACLTAQH